MKIVVLDGYAANPGDLSWQGLERLGELTVYERTPADQVAGRIGDARAAFTNKSIITDEVMAACPNLEYIGVLATGYNTVDVEAARRRGIVVCNVPAYSTPSVAQLTIALLLEICHHAGEHSRLVHEGAWTRSRDFTFWTSPLIELAGKTMGLIGFGSIGQATARIAQALGMRVIAYSRTPKQAEGVEMVSLETLLKTSDVVSLHCPLTPQTQGMINKDAIARMKSGAILLNTARGPLIVEQDLRDALESGRLYAAGVDVVTTEPIPEDSPLLGAKNIIITPHIAWAPRESRTRLMNVTVSNLESFLAGNPVNRV